MSLVLTTFFMVYALITFPSISDVLQETRHLLNDEKRDSSISYNQFSKLADLLITHALQIGFYGGLMVGAVCYIAHGLISAFVFFTAVMIYP